MSMRHKSVQSLISPLPPHPTPTSTSIKRLQQRIICAIQKIKNKKGTHNKLEIQRADKTSKFDYDWLGFHDRMREKASGFCQTRTTAFNFLSHV
jgi:hypothetical protein